MPHLSRFPDSPESPLPLSQDATDDDIAGIPTQKQSARTRSLHERLDDIIRLDTIKIAARRSRETIGRIPTVHIPTISQHIARIPTVHIPTISQHIPVVGQRRLSVSPRDRLLLIILLVGLLVPICALLLECLNAYCMYSYAQNGMGQLLQAKTIFIGSQVHPSGFLDIQKLHRAQHALQAAHNDFQQLQSLLQRDALASTVLPQQITSMRALSKIGIDVTEIGQRLTQTALLLAPTLRGSLIQDTGKPLVTPATLTLLRATSEYLLPRLHDMENIAHTLSLATLPISLTQRQQLTHLLSAIPGARADIQQTHDMLDAVGWILGVKEPRTFLIQTMDSSELRPTGGFTGQFGELHIQGGRIAPFTLKNIGLYEENNPESSTNGQLAPPPYRSWWPIPNWGLRDSNLSADFPTSAQLALSAYKHEFGRSLDGVILLSPLMMTHVLSITGPIVIPAYHETINAQNLENRLHYYQLNNAGIRKEELVEHIEDPALARKSFTAALTRTLIDHVRHAPPDELIAIARELLQALLNKDVQIYVTNPQIEALLIQRGAAAQIDRSTRHDGLYIVQADLNANKASQYVHTQFHDMVMLDNYGGATHVLQIRFVYNQIGPVYGLDTYRDYIRVYVPPAARFLWGNGFDSGTAFCGGALGACPIYDPYSDGTLLCPANQSEPGATTPQLNDPYAGKFHPLDRIGPPTNRQSDTAGRAMFGGWVIVPKNCTMTATFSWYVPPMGTTYALLFQRQSSTFPELDLTILTTAQYCGKLHAAGKHFNGLLRGRDAFFSLTPVHFQSHAETGCEPHLRV